MNFEDCDLSKLPTARIRTMVELFEATDGEALCCIKDFACNACPFDDCSKICVPSNRRLRYNLLKVEMLSRKESAKSFDEEDNVNHPAHYTSGKIEVIDFIEDQALDFRLANVIKYVCRYRNKNGEEDLKKAAWYLDRFINKEYNKEE